MPNQEDMEALHIINKRFVSDDPSNNLPTVILPDGTTVQTGTVGALIQNIKIYDKICAGEIVEDLSREQIERMLTVPIPTLKKIGLFDIFPPGDWIAGSSEGRRFVGKKAEEKGY